MSNNKTTSPPSLLRRIQKVDVRLSKIIFRLSLPLPLEFLLSLPGNLIGPPFLQIMGPLWIMILLDNDFNVAGNFMTQSVVWTLAIGLSVLLLLVPWILFLRGQTSILSRFFFSHASFALCPLVGMGLSNAYTAMAWPDSNKWYVTTLCFHFLMLYNASCIVILWLKHGIQRPRPCVVFPEFMERKHFSVIPRTLAKIGPNTSFPSGDVMAATCLALPLWYHHHVENYGGPFFYTPLLLVGLTALGRMYFLAHHLCDTLAGIAVPWCLHLLCTVHTRDSFWDPFFPQLGSAQWYHPFGAFLALVVASRFRRGDHK